MVQQNSYLTDEERWQAVANRDRGADGAFLYSVRTTGIYCRPTCAARLAKRENVRFHATRADAEAAGFRACKRCRPADASINEHHATGIAGACRLIEQSAVPPSLTALAEAAGMSPYHFHRVFRAQLGVTPRAYARAHKRVRLQAQLPKGRSVTSAVFAAGFSSSSQFYSGPARSLGMSPHTYRTGGEGTRIRFAVGRCWLGEILVAATDVGVCAILMGDDPDELVHDLEMRFPRAELVGSDEKFEQLVARVVGFLEEPTRGFGLPLDIRGTAFQQRVWAALEQIPLGSTATYTEIANRLGVPKSVRAVAQACGANPLAVVIPCHRVVRRDGSLAGYRWGIERKAELLQRESNVMAAKRSN